MAVSCGGRSKAADAGNAANEPRCSTTTRYRRQTRNLSFHLFSFFLPTPTPHVFASMHACGLVRGTQAPCLVSSCPNTEFFIQCPPWTCMRLLHAPVRSCLGMRAPRSASSCPNMEFIQCPHQTCMCLPLRTHAVSSRGTRVPCLASSCPNMEYIPFYEMLLV